MPAVGGGSSGSPRPIPFRRGRPKVRGGCYDRCAGMGLPVSRLGFGAPAGGVRWARCSSLSKASTGPESRARRRCSASDCALRGIEVVEPPASPAGRLLASGCASCSSGIRRSLPGPRRHSVRGGARAARRRCDRARRWSGARGVVVDRFIDSSLAYQGAARGLGVDAVLELNRTVIGDVEPDRTLLLRVPVDVALARIGAERQDRIEAEGAEFLANGSTRAFEALSVRFERIDAIDAMTTSGGGDRRAEIAATPRTALMLRWSLVAGLKARSTRSLSRTAVKLLLTCGAPRRVRHTRTSSTVRPGWGRASPWRARSRPLCLVVCRSGRAWNTSRISTFSSPLGDQIRIGDIHALRHDLHLRPFEGDRRVYIVERADSMNPDAADALLKSLEEPPSYATVVLLADRLALLPETIRSRCQLVPFRRLSPGAVCRLARGACEWGWYPRRTPRCSLARAASGTLERARRLLDPERSSRCAATLIELVRSLVSVTPSCRCSAGAARGRSRRWQRPVVITRALAPAKVRRLTTTRSRRARPSSVSVGPGAGPSAGTYVEVVESVATWCRDLLVVVVEQRTRGRDQRRLRGRAGSTMQVSSTPTRSRERRSRPCPRDTPTLRAAAPGWSGARRNVRLDTTCAHSCSGPTSLV